MDGNVGPYLAYQAIYEFDIFIDDVTLLGNRPGGEHVVSCTHRHTDVGLFTSGYGLSDTFSDW